MKKWQYRYEVFEEKGNGQFQEYLNQLGMEGWELVAVQSDYNRVFIYHSLVFKRPIEEPTKIEVGPGQTIYYLPTK